MTSRDEARGIEVRWQDDNDAPLAPLLFDTVAEVRDALSRDLQVDWPLPTRVPKRPGPSRWRSGDA
jgi:hypothetical protein